MGDNCSLEIIGGLEINLSNSKVLKSITPPKIHSENLQNAIVTPGEYSFKDSSLKDSMKQCKGHYFIIFI